MMGPVLYRVQRLFLQATSVVITSIVSGLCFRGGSVTSWHMRAADNSLGLSTSRCNCERNDSPASIASGTPSKALFDNSVSRNC